MRNHIEILDILRNLHKVSGLRVSIHDADCRETYGYPATCSAYCAAIQSDPAILEKCKQCDAQMLQKVRESGEAILYRCPQGLYEAAAPIYHYGVLSGFLMIGQARDTTDNSLDQLRKRATEILGDAQTAATLADHVPAMEEGTFRAYLNITAVIAEYLTETNRVQMEGGRLAELIAQYLRQHYHEHIRLESLAQHFGYCNATLTKTFRREYGTTIFGFLRDIRLDNAARLLAETKKPVKEIAMTCGIDDQNYFSRVFTERYGCSPTSYRERSFQT